MNMKKILLLITLILVATTDLISKVTIPSHNLIDFNFTDKELSDMVTELAEIAGMNIILPQGANAIKQKVNIHLPNKVSLDKAWEYISMFLIWQATR